jgi:hypothetical protein
MNILMNTEQNYVNKDSFKEKPSYVLKYFHFISHYMLKSKVLNIEMFFLRHCQSHTLDQQ